MEFPDLQSEKTLLADIELLRPQFPQTQELYREVCTLMFFRYGMTPTANKLYQLVRKGSMSAPAEALNRFWENLREKSRVTIVHPDLPEALRLAAGELTAALWKSAQAAAQDGVKAFRAEAQQQVDEANAAATEAGQERDEMAETVERAQVAFDLAQSQIASLQQDLAAAAATNFGLQARITENREELAAQQRRLDNAAREHGVELDKLRAATELTAERYRALEARALLDVDRERTATLKLQKAVEGERAAALAAAERQRLETAALQTVVGDLRQQTGSLEGTLLAVSNARDHAHQQLLAMNKQLEQALTRAAAAEGKTEQLRGEWQKTLESLDQRIAAARLAERKQLAAGKKARRAAP